LRSEVRAPRARVALDGADVPGVISVDLHSNNHLAADRFRVRFAASVVSQDSLHEPGRRIEISIGLDDAWVSMVVGTADAVTFDPIHGVLDLEGRDLSSTMIEARIDETFANRTSSEIAETLAARHGLRAIVERTSTPVGRYYQAEHDRLTLGQFAKAMTEWDLLAFLAGREGFDLFMDGDALRFGPQQTAEPSEIRREDCTTLQMDHSLRLARNIEVTVRSWGTKAGAAVVQMARGGTGSQSSWKHRIVRPNLTADDAQKLAERTLADLLRHEWTATATMPGEASLTPRSRVAIAGTGTVWDRQYAISELSRHLDVQRGFTQRLCLQGSSNG
jgi:phage protein D